MNNTGKCVHFLCEREALFHIATKDGFIRKCGAHLTATERAMQDQTAIARAVAERQGKNGKVKR